MPTGIYKHRKGYHLTEEHKQKIGRANKGCSPNNTSFKKKHIAWNKGKVGVYSEETRRKMSEAKKGKTYALGHKVSKEHRKKISDAMKNNTHCLGIERSLKTRRKMSKAKRGNKNPYFGKMPPSIQKEGIFNGIKRGWYDINGKRMFVRSKWEANIALYLNFLIQKKEILKWEYEPETFIFEKIKFGTRSYKPDFRIVNNDNTLEYWEVKGYMTARSKTQIKRMAKYYPKIKLIIIDKDIYKDIKNKLGKMLKFY